MPTPVTEKLLTADEFDLLLEPIEGGKMELIDGRLVTMVPVTGDHGELQVDFGSALMAFVRQHRLGTVFVETGFRLQTAAGRPHIVRAPDVSFVSSGRMPGREARRRGSMPLAPDLAVEVTSPEDRDSEVQRKVEDYLAAGTQRVWVVRPERQTVTVHRPTRDSHTYAADQALSSDDAGFTAEGFTLALRELFAQD